jgi:hypothetical protein
MFSGLFANAGMYAFVLSAPLSDDHRLFTADKTAGLQRAAITSLSPVN